MKYMKKNLIVIIGLVLAGFTFGSALNQDFVTFVYNGGADSSDGHGGSCTAGALAAAGGDPVGVFFTATGQAIIESTDNSVTVTENPGTGEYKLYKAAAFASLVTGTIGFVNFVAPDTDGFFIFVKIDDNAAYLQGTSWASNTTCSIWVGGCMKTLGGTINSDIANAGTVNCDVLIRGNETFPSDETVAGGGGTVTTMLRFLGVDSSWVRIVPTRTVIGGGKANGPFDTSIMPTITLNANVEFILSQSFIQLDGLYFTGNTATTMVGSTSSDNLKFTNCVFDNASTNASALDARADNNSSFYNCDFIMSGASGASWNVSIDASSSFVNCRFRHDSSGPAGGIEGAGIESVVGCLFYDYAAGTAIQESANTTNLLIVNNTFENIPGKCISIPNLATPTANIFNNIAKDCGIFVDNLYSGTANNNLFAMFNHLNNVTTDYDDFSGDLGFQDLTSDPLFISEANDNYNLQSGSPAKNSGPFLTNRGSMSDAEAGGGGGQPIIGGSVIR